MKGVPENDASREDLSSVFPVARQKSHPRARQQPKSVSQCDNTKYVTSNVNEMMFMLVNSLMWS